MEKMLGVLKTANIVATLSPSGEVKEMTGYKEIGAQMLAGVNTTDVNAKNMIQNQWDRMVEGSLIKNNLSQFFKIFPDSAIHIGEKWKLNSNQSGDLDLTTTTFYKLKDINNDIAIIQSEGEVRSDSTITNLMGYNAVANVKGKQQGQYEMETKTGMLISSTITSKIEGTIEMMGRDIPVVIESSVKMSGRKIK